MANKAKRKGANPIDSNRNIKEKKQRTAPTNTSLLPPCKVCEEPAAGFHYGVNTCEACKGFFRRTLVREGDYMCIGADEKCDVVQVGQTGKKRICPRCRHLKCIAVGMSPEAIKTGRYTHAKRTQDIIEYRQAKGGMTSANNDNIAEEATCPSPATNNTTTSTNTTTTTKEKGLNIPAAPAIGTPKFIRSTGSASSPRAPVSNLLPTVVNNTATFVDFSPVSQDGSNPPLCTTLSPARFELGVQSVSPDTGSVASAGITSSGQICELVTALPPFSPPELPSPFSLVDNILDHTLGGELGRCDESGSVGSSILTPLSSASSPDCPSVTSLLPSSSAEKTSDLLSEEECRKLTQHLLQSHNKLHLCKYEMSPEEMLAKQQACFENCRARTEAFGPMGRLSEEEYQEIYQTTGIDVDDRQSFITVLSKMLDENIRQFISFVKTIPGFANLTMNDQIRLLKDNRCEVGSICQSTGYNHNLQVMTLPSGRSFCHHDMEKFGGEERARLRQQVLLAIQKLGLSEDEKVLFKCMVLFTVGNDDVDEPERVSAIQWKVTQCLLWLLKENKRPNPNLFFSQMISAFMRVKVFAKEFYEWIRSKPFEHYAQFKNNELLAEWFSNS